MAKFPNDWNPHDAVYYGTPEEKARAEDEKQKDDTLATFRKLVKHAGDGVLPPGWMLSEKPSHPLEELGGTWDGSKRTWALLTDCESRDLCVGFWLRRLDEGNWGMMARGELDAHGSDPPFQTLAALILALPEAEARRVFKEKTK